MKLIQRFDLLEQLLSLRIAAIQIMKRHDLLACHWIEASKLGRKALRTAFAQYSSHCLIQSVVELSQSEETRIFSDSHDSWPRLREPNRKSETEESKKVSSSLNCSLAQDVNHLQTVSFARLEECNVIYSTDSRLGLRHIQVLQDSIKQSLTPLDDRDAKSIELILARLLCKQASWLQESQTATGVSIENLLETAIEICKKHEENSSKAYYLMARY